MEYKKYNKTIVVNGNKVDVEFTVKVNEDDNRYIMDQDFESESKKAEFVSKVENGELFSAWVEVQASAEGLTGYDTLGACVLHANNMFNSTPFNQSVEATLIDNGMEANALDDLNRQLETEYSRLVNKAKQYKKYSKVEGE